MKIAIINTHRQDGLGGSEIQSDIIARGLTDLGHKVVYLAVNGKNTYSVPYQVLPALPSGKAIAEIAIQIRPDIVYWRMNKNYFRDAAKALRSQRIPIVFAVSAMNDLSRFPALVDTGNMNSLYSSARKALTSFWNHKGFNWVNGVVCQTREQYIKCSFNNKIIIPNSNPETSLADFTWPRPYVVWASNVKRIKRPEACLDLGKAIERYGCDLIMFGKIQDKRYEPWLTKMGSMQRNIYFLGFQEPRVINGALRDSLALVHSSIQEGFPNVFLQAWFQAKPVVSLSVDPDDLISQFGLGFVAKNDAQRFHSQVTKLICEPELADEIGSQCLRYATEHFEKKKNVLKLNGFFSEILAQKTE